MPAQPDSASPEPSTIGTLDIAPSTSATGPCQDASRRQRRAHGAWRPPPLVVYFVDDDPRASTALLSPRLGAVASRNAAGHVGERG
jgi:hypothetical protein